MICIHFKSYWIAKKNYVKKAITKHKTDQTALQQLREEKSIFEAELKSPNQCGICLLEG
jgi:hypothetical protein